MYLMNCTRPDIAYAVSKLSRYTSNPGVEHWKAIIRVLRYLRFTRNIGLNYTRYPAVLEGYCDANWISDTRDSKSTSGYVFTLGGADVSWKSSKQTCIARSTMESEFIALDKAGEEAEWLRHFLEDIPIWPKSVPAICIHCNSQSAIGRAQSHMYNDFDSIMADEEIPNEVKEDVADISPFDPTKKKKKKKVVIQDPADDDAVDKLAEKTESLSEFVNFETCIAPAVSDGLENTFSGLKKKKKKPVQTDVLSDEKENLGDDFDDHIGEDEEGEGIILQPQFPWEGSDRDYEYEEVQPPFLFRQNNVIYITRIFNNARDRNMLSNNLASRLISLGGAHYQLLLGRVFNILRENNPELAGDRRRTVMRPPQVLREGTKKTVFVNFMDLCKTMHRQPEHVMTFLLAEMGTSGSLDGQQRLVVKGRFAPKNFEGILRRYVNEYVICNGCKSPDTILSKENRLFFLRCEKCGSGRSVAPIKAGFVARVGRRKAGT
ncbi:hypothetical protein HYC85_007411 [Camellia sinensis]|uniref:Eukaryotic translation initiation factor 2 subunit beta n=1 Tax=Camellia sinensis TaxID=4442 RepID=A0A7J7HPR4_CAMSI|nr:hypothetical protein HYC85_007411 [Camellia sinensis]